MTLRNAFEDLATEATVSALNTNILQLLTALHQEDSPHVSGHYGQAMLGIRSDSDTPTADNGDYTIHKMDEEGRLKVASKPASYAPVIGNIIANGGTVFINTERFSNLMIHCSGTFNTVNVTFEGSLNSTNGTDGNWFTVQGARSNANTPETSTGNLSAAPAYAWELSVNAMKWFRVRATAWTSGTQVWTMMPGTYATEPIPVAQVTATQPVSGTVTVTSTTANIGTSGLVVYTDSSTNLGVSATFTGTNRDGGATPGYNKFIAHVFADQAGTLRIEKSTDGTTWRLAASVAVGVGEAKELEVKTTTRYHRVVYVNGGVAQTTFLLTSAYHRI